SDRAHPGLGSRSPVEGGDAGVLDGEDVAGGRDLDAGRGIEGDRARDAAEGADARHGSRRAVEGGYIGGGGDDEAGTVRREDGVRDAGIGKRRNGQSSRGSHPEDGDAVRGGGHIGLEVQEIGIGGGGIQDPEPGAGGLAVADGIGSQSEEREGGGRGGGRRDEERGAVRVLEREGVREGRSGSPDREGVLDAVRGGGDPGADGAGGAGNGGGGGPDDRRKGGDRGIGEEARIHEVDGDRSRGVRYGDVGAGGDRAHPGLGSRSPVEGGDAGVLDGEDVAGGRDLDAGRGIEGDRARDAAEGADARHGARRAVEGGYIGGGGDDEAGTVRREDGVRDAGIGKRRNGQSSRGSHPEDGDAVRGG